MVIALPANKIEGAIKTEPSRNGDGSFDEELNKAQDQIKRKLSFFPLNKLEALFYGLPLSLDFNTQTETEQNLKDDYYSKEDTDAKVANQHQTKSNKESKTKQDNYADKRLLFTDSNAIKKALINFVQNSAYSPLAMPINSTISSTPTTFNKFNLQFLIDQIIENAKFVKDQRRAELSLILKEESLGQIDLSLSSRNGLVSIQIMASAETKKDLQDSLEDLENALVLAEVKLDKIKIVEVNNSEQHRLNG